MFGFFYLTAVMEKLVIEYSDYKEQLDRFIEEGEALERMLSDSKEVNATAFAVAASQDWLKKISEMLRTAFEKENNSHRRNFDNIGEDRFGKEKPIKTTADLKALTTRRVLNLKYLQKLCIISDVMQSPALEKERKNLSVVDIENLLLLKLYQLYKIGHTDVFSIQNILKINGIVLQREEDYSDVANELKGFIEIEYDEYGRDEVYAKIKVSGIKKVEQLLTASERSKNKDEDSELREKVDEILTWLQRNEHGQEIIFDEIMELKELLGTLTKKQWKQILLGKIADVAINKATDNEVLNFIYGKFFEGKLFLSEQNG